VARLTLFDWHFFCATIAIQQTRRHILLQYIGIIFITVLLTSAYFIISKRRRVPKYELNPDELPEVGECLLKFAGLTKSAVHEGNRVEVFQNGSLFAEIANHIKAAKDTVHLETFVWDKGELERKFVELFCAKVKQGVKVRILLDAIGSMDADETQLQKLRDGGVDLRIYCKVSWWNLRRFNHRTHRKILVIDGNVGFTFGHGIADQWRGNGEDKDHWRDTGVRIEGPAVFALQSVFMENWIEETSCIPTEKSCFPTLSPQGDTSAHVVSSAAGDAVSGVGLLYSLAIASARKHIYIQNPYFAPEKSMVKLLGQMVSRGVKVHLMVPGKHTDNPFVRWAGCSLYRPLLEAGVNIYEFKPTLLHQKIVVVDGKWAHVGSTNFDARSLALNEEIGVGLLDKPVAAQLIAAFHEDLRRCDRIKLDEWRKRPWFYRVFDEFAYLLRDPF